MIFTKLTIENFLTIGSIECALDNKGLVLIQGENMDDSSQDSNGSGKSSFPDAISWCLYGSTARGESGDNVVNRTAKKECEVTVELMDDAVKYIISRYRKHSTGKNRLVISKVENGTTVDLTKGTDKLTQDLVNKIVGCSEEVFNAAIYAGQEAMPDLPGMTDKQLKMLVEEAAGIDRLQEAYSMAQANLRLAKADYIASTNKLINLKEQVAQIVDTLADLEVRKNAHETSRETKLSDLVDKLRVAKDDVQAATTVKNNAELELVKINTALASSQAKIDAVDSENQEQRRLMKEVSTCKSVEVLSKSGLERATKDLRTALEKLAGIENSVGKFCEECNKPYTAADLDDARKIAEQNKSKAVVTAKQAQASYKAAQEQHLTAITALTDFQAHMTDVSSEITHRDALNASAAILNADIKKLDTAKKYLSEAIKTYKETQAAENPFDLVIVKNTATKDLKEGEVKAQADLVSEKANGIRVLEGVEKVFGPAGVRAHILDTVTPFLNHRTAEYLGTLTDENITATWNTLSTTAKGELREKFVIEVNSKVGAANFKGLSGGEKRKVRLSCSMALQDLVSSRASKPIELYIADEIDHALDEAGLERLMTILDDKAKTKGTALVISHNSLGSYIRQSVKIVKENGFSRLEGVL